VGVQGSALQYTCEHWDAQSRIVKGVALRDGVLYDEIVANSVRPRLTASSIGASVIARLWICDRVSAPLCMSGRSEGMDARRAGPARDETRMSAMRVQGGLAPKFVGEAVLALRGAVGVWQSRLFQV
jgi:hypothetical protein